jgi:hypothetical protein
MTEVPVPWLRALVRIATERGWQKLARLAMREIQRTAEVRNHRIRRALLKSDEELDNALAFTGAPE